MSAKHNRELADTLQEQRLRTDKRPCRVCGKPTRSTIGICLAHDARETYARVRAACCDETGLPEGVDEHAAAVTADVLRKTGR